MERRFGDISVMAEVFGQLKAANVKVIMNYDLLCQKCGINFSASH